MGKPAARITDMHICPKTNPGPVPHVGGPIVMGSPNVLIGNLPAARVGDMAVCVGPPDKVSSGSSGVLINGKQAARLGDSTAHGGKIVVGMPTVLIGGGGGGGGSTGGGTDTNVTTTVVAGAAVGASTTKQLGEGRDSEAGDTKDGSASAAGTHFSQEQANSCVIASSRNLIHKLTGKNIPEEKLRAEMREIMKKPDHDFNKSGINPIFAGKLLEKNGVETVMERGVEPSQLKSRISDGKPILIGFKNPGHRVLLEKVTADKNGKPVYVVRDPAPTYKGLPRNMAEKEFKTKYNQNAPIFIPK